MTEVATPEQVVAANEPQSITAEQPAEVPIAEQNGTATTPVKTANGSAATNGTPVKKVKSAKKEKPQPINPEENPEGWLEMVKKSKAGINKVNYHILKWIQETAEPDEAKRKPLPGKPGSVKPAQFVEWLSDGTVLAQLANALAPNSITTIHEGDAAKEKENQTANLQAFVSFKDSASIAPDHSINVEQLQARGSEAYESLLKTLYYLSTQAKEKFAAASSVDVQQIAEEVQNLSRVQIFQQIRHSVSSLFSEIVKIGHKSEASKDAKPVENGAAETSHENGAAAEEPKEQPKVAEAPAVNGSH